MTSHLTRQSSPVNRASFSGDTGYVSVLSIICHPEFITSVVVLYTFLSASWRSKTSIICSMFAMGSTMRTYASTVNANWCRRLCVYIWVHWQYYENTKVSSTHSVLQNSLYITKMSLMANLLTCVLYHYVQWTRNIYSVLFQCWGTVYDAGPALKQHWLKVSWLLST